MKELAEFCKELKKDFTPKTINAKKPVNFWSEKDILDNKIIDAFVIIFRTPGCSWALDSGCSMCGYFNDSQWDKVTEKDLITQFETALNKYNNQKFVKIFTSGSFLDEKEFHTKARKEILTRLYETADKVSVESRPEYLSQKNLKKINEVKNLKEFEVGVGLETANDQIRRDYINKGFSFNDYKKAANNLKKFDYKLKSYVLIKPPFITEKEAIKDSISTVKKIKTITDTVSFNPTNVQRNTVVNYLWQRKQYRPAWLWSVIEILKKSKEIVKDKRIKCDIVGGGNIRGAHNCKNCDKTFLKQINDFSLNQNLKTFKNLNCECKEKWLDQLDLEAFGFGSLVNMYGDSWVL